jgi:putative peptidoglycan lipid II flippase
MTSPTYTQPPSALRQIVRAAGTVMAAFLISNLVGLVRGMLIYRAFGTSASLDSFWAANRVTETLFNLMAGGALASAFVPTFTGFLTRDEKANAWKLASATANLLVLVLTSISILAWFFAPQIVRYGLFALAPDQNPGQAGLTVELLRLMLPSVVIFGLSGLVMAVLNAHQVFWIPAIAPSMYSLGMILGVTVLPSSLGVQRLAYGAVLGAGMHFLVQIPALLRLRGRYSLTLGRGLPAVKDVLRLMGPRLLGVAVVQLNFIVNIIIALSLPEGSASSINLAFSLMLIPQMAIAQSIAIASLPTFSAQVAQGKINEMRSALAATLRAVLLLAVPASLGLIMLRVPLVRMLYEDGQFGARSTQFVAWALLWYAAGLVGHSVVEIISRAFYALHDTRTPVAMTLISMTLNVLFSLLFSRWFLAAGWLPHGGLALANSLATALETAGLLILMRRKLNGLEGGRLWKALSQAALAAGGMSAMLACWLLLSFAFRPWLQALGGAALGVLVYGLILWLLRVGELRQVIGFLKNRLGMRSAS